METKRNVLFGQSPEEIQEKAYEVIEEMSSTRQGHYLYSFNKPTRRTDGIGVSTAKGFIKQIGLQTRRGEADNTPTCEEVQERATNYSKKLESMIKKCEENGETLAAKRLRNDVVPVVGVVKRRLGLW